MSMQRSFLATISLVSLTITFAQAHILDEINDMFHSEVWELTSEEQSQGHSFPTHPTTYEKELPRNMQPPLPPIEPEEPEKTLVLNKENITFNDIIGQAEAVHTLRSVVKQFRHPEHLKRLGGTNKKGILLEGPPGTGKTMLARAIANELGYSFHECPGSSFVEVWVGQGAQRVRQLFDEARRRTPSLIFIDEIDAVAAANRDQADSGGGLEYRQTLNELLTQMNAITHDSRMMVIVATNTIAAVDEAFKAPHRFEIVTIGLPSEQGRRETLHHYLEKLPHVEEISEPIFESIIEKTRGFSQAQIQSFVNNAVHFAAAEEAKKVTTMHLLLALENARNSMRTGMFGSKSMEYDTVKFSDIAGLESVVKEFEFLVHSLKHPDRLKDFGAVPHKGILLAGRPGCGKTMLVRALANEASCQVLYASGSSFDGKFMGDGAKAIRELFQKAHMVSPAIIFIDEIDAISTRTGGHQTVNELLTQMDGFTKDLNVIVIGATNVLPDVDYRLRREGRFSHIINIGLPDDAERRSILELYINRLPRVNQEEVPYDKIVLHTKDFSGAGLKNIVNDAAMQACKEGASFVEAHHFEEALNRALRARKQRV